MGAAFGLLILVLILEGKKLEVTFLKLLLN